MDSMDFLDFFDAEFAIEEVRDRVCRVGVKTTAEKTPAGVAANFKTMIHSRGQFDDAAQHICNSISQ